MLDLNILKSSISDFLSPKIFLISCVSFIITTIIVFLLLYISVENIFDLPTIMSSLFDNNDMMQEILGYSLIGVLLKHQLVMFVFQFLLMLGLGIFLYYIFFMIYSFVISFFTSVFIEYINKKHYLHINKKGINLFSSLLFYIKIMIISALLFILFIPLYFIPALNLIIFLPLYYMFHKIVIYDVSSIINDTDEYKMIIVKNGLRLKVQTALCFILSLIPIVGILLYPFYIIYLSHFIFQESQRLRN